MVVHLMDLDDDDDDDDNINTVLDQVWHGPDIVGSLRSSFNHATKEDEEENASFSNQEEEEED